LKLSFIAFFPILFLYFYSEELFSIIFGEQWLMAGVYAKNISPYIFFHFIASPLGMVPLVVNKQEKAFLWGLVESILFVSIYIIVYLLYDDLQITLSILSFIMGIYFLIYFKWIYTISKLKVIK
jgi:O-antigen/teichoic acid export membrane protein